VALIVAEPATLPVTSPLPFTDATVVFELAHVTVRPLSGFPFESFGVAVSWIVAPTSTLADAAPQICGGSWTSRPGNSSNPPDSVPPFMAVIASSSITKSGATISGDVPKIVIVKTNPGYGPSPGQTGTGTVVVVLCGS